MKGKGASSEYEGCEFFDFSFACWSWEIGIYQSHVLIFSSFFFFVSRLFFQSISFAMRMMMMMEYSHLLGVASKTN